jgi:hypothetical protein
MKVVLLWGTDGHTDAIRTSQSPDRLMRLHTPRAAGSTDRWEGYRYGSFPGLRRTGLGLPWIGFIMGVCSGMATCAQGEEG